MSWFLLAIGFAVIWVGMSGHVWACLGDISRSRSNMGDSDFRVSLEIDKIFQCTSMCVCQYVNEEIGAFCFGVLSLSF